MCVCHNDDRLDALDGNPPACTFSKIGCDFEHALCKPPRVLVVDAVDEAYDFEATQLDHAGAVLQCTHVGRAKVLPRFIRNGPQVRREGADLAVDASFQQHPFAGMDDAIEDRHEERQRERARFLKNGELCGLHSAPLELTNWA